MGNYFSGGRKPISVLDDDDDEDAGSGGRILYNWKIDGFSSLRNHEEGRWPWSSGMFEAKGYAWYLEMTIKSMYWKKYICLRLSLDSMPSYQEIEAEYNLWIFDQRHRRHIKKRGTYNYKTTRSTPYQCMISLEKFQDASSRFLINDSCIFGVEILQAHSSKIAECLSVSKGTGAHVLYTWKIECGAKAERPHGSSEAFEAGGLKWRIIIHPSTGKEEEFVAIFLRLDHWSVAEVGSGIYVEFSLCVKDQINGKHKKFKKISFFDCTESVRGWPEFLSYQDLYTASKGFLVNDTCIIQASVAVVGSLSRNY